LRDTGRIVINGGRIVRRGYKCFAARGGKAVLTFQPETVRRNVPDRDAVKDYRKQF
jgi:hypothetical protein